MALPFVTGFQTGSGQAGFSLSKSPKGNGIGATGSKTPPPAY